MSISHPQLMFDVDSCCENRFDVYFLIETIDKDHYSAMLFDYGGWGFYTTHEIEGTGIDTIYAYAGRQVRQSVFHSSPCNPRNPCLCRPAGAPIRVPFFSVQSA